MQTPTCDAAPVSQFEQHRANLRMVALLDELESTPDKLRLKPAYSDKLIELHALCASEEMYQTLVSVYEL